MQQSKQLRLVSRPDGDVKDSDFQLDTVPVPVPADKEFVVKVTHISIDPAMRGWMSSAPSYMPPVAIGEVMRAPAVGRVTQSRHWEYAEGDWVHGNFGVQEHAVSDGENVYKIHVDGPLTPQVYLGATGLTGLTAYFGIMHVGQVREAETVLVSGAAGGVGTAVGQIAKIQGAKAIGIAGGPEKCKLLVNELRFDGAVDYKRSDFREQLRDHTDKRVDVFFDNIGG